MAAEEITEIKYPISIQWIFENNFFNECYGGERFKTKRYQLPGFPVTYYLSLNFEPVDDYYPDISVQLNCFCDYDDVKIEANFLLAVKLFCDKKLAKQKIKQTKCNFTNAINKIECYSVKDWQWWNDDGEFVFEISGIFTIKDLPSIPLSIKVPKLNQQIFNDKNGKDFTIIADKKELKVHKSILQQVSTVFARMFELEWKETIEGKIEFKNLSFKLAKIAIDLFYGKKYWRFLAKDEYLQLYQFAEQYDIISLKHAVKNSILLIPQNIIEYLNLVFESKCDELIQHCIDYLIICTQYSLPIKDINSISNDAKILIAERMLFSPLLKKNIKDENKTRVSNHSAENQNDNHSSQNDNE
uniref:BTB domain-containing protein n=1 Tax=Panagrolaimus davidi TaxID=227884 RepID=A0A914Q119_9BILA